MAMSSMSMLPPPVPESTAKRRRVAATAGGECPEQTPEPALDPSPVSTAASDGCGDDDTDVLAGYVEVKVSTSRLSRPYKTILVKQKKMKPLEHIYKFIPPEHPYWFEDSQHLPECECWVCDIVWERNNE